MPDRPLLTMALGAHAAAVDRRLHRWEEQDAVQRLWSGDHRLWVPAPAPEIADRLGWLTLPTTMAAQTPAITSFAQEAMREGLRQVVLLGMGGSSLAPEVFARTLPPRPGYPELSVLDSTHPGAVAAVEHALDPARTLFLVSSKSGTTIEPLSFFNFFWAPAAHRGEPGRHFAAVTDPGSFLADLGAERGFRRVFLADPNVGGRFSALSHFGLVPAGLLGFDPGYLLGPAAAMAEASRRPPRENPGFVLGAALGELAAAGRDKATFACSPALAAFPAWIEQLVAESTGKGGTGIVPVADEPLAGPNAYGEDRSFIYLALAGDADPRQSVALDTLQAAGHPVIRIGLEQPADLGAAMYLLETAVAMAGSVLGIHPFDQPDVQLAKELASRAMKGEEAGEPIEAVSIHDRQALAGALDGLLARSRAGDYFALQAFVQPTAAVAAALQAARLAVRERFRLATTLGFGPRFLHSTGQLHKGGPNTGLFLQLVDDASADLPVPGTSYTFGRLLSAQADGDYRALSARGRRVLRVDLGPDPADGAAVLSRALLP